MSRVRDHQEGMWVVGKSYAGEEAQHDWQAIQPPDGIVALRDVGRAELFSDMDLFWEALKGLLRSKALMQKTSAALRGIVLYLPRASMHNSASKGRGRGGGGRGGGNLTGAGGATNSQVNDGR